MIAAILIAFGLRAYRLGYQELRGDEAFGYFFSLRSFGDILKATLALNEPHPVASYFLQHVWLNGAGHSEFALRYLSVCFGVLAVALIFRLARRLRLAPATAMAAAFLLAISPYAIWHNQDARMYSISLALTLASAWLSLEALRSRRAATWLAYAGVSWLALQTHYFAAFILVAQDFFILSLASTRRLALPTLRRWLSAQIGLALLYAPWLLLARETLGGYRGNGESVGWWALWRRALGVFAAGETIPVEQQRLFLAVALILLALGVVTLAMGGPKRRRTAWFLLLYLTVPLLATWFSALSRPIFNERYLIAALPPFYILVAAGFGALSMVGAGKTGGIRRTGWALRALAGLLLLALLAGAGVSLNHHYTDPAYSKTRGWRQLAAAFERYAAGIGAADVRLAENFPDPTLWYYYQGPVGHVTLPPAPADAEGAAMIAAELAAQDVKRVILSVQPMPWWDPGGIASAALQEQYARIGETVVGVWPVQIFERFDEQNVSSVGAVFVNGTTLRGAAIRPQILPPGGVLGIHLQWRGPAEALSDSTKLFLHLLDANGGIIAQNDQPFTATELASRTSNYSLFLPETLPSGPYRLIAGLYDPARPGAPRLLTEDGGDYILLAELSAP